MSGCAQRTGFLTLTMCDEPVAAACVKCGKPICVGHLQNEPSGSCCPDCAVIGLDADEASRRGLDSSYYRQSTNYDAGYTTYRASDYQSFEGQGGEMGGGGASGEWSDGDGGDGSDSGSAGDFQDS
jgi:uncharacterized membrane protein YgcG